jgi:hypothetical protein
MRVLKRLALFFPALLLASVITPIAQAATLTFHFSKSLEAGFPNIPVATLTISDVPGGATKWTLGANWGQQYGSAAFLHFLEYEYRGNNGLTASDYRVTAGRVAVPSFDNGSAGTKIVKFPGDDDITRFHTGESVSWIFANTKAEDFSVRHVQIDALNTGSISYSAGVKFSANTAVPPAPAPFTPPAGTVSRDFTNTVGGIDVNKNGVRDDIEDFIVKTYPDPKQRAAMMQYAAGVQNALLNSSTKQAAFFSSQRVYRSLDCVILILGEKDFAKKTDEILAMMLNTRNRAKAYVTARSASGGQVYDTGVKNPCDVQ